MTFYERFKFQGWTTLALLILGIAISLFATFHLLAWTIGVFIGQFLWPAVFYLTDSGRDSNKV